jgi:hypothetical protein
LDLFNTFNIALLGTYFPYKGESASKFALTYVRIGWRGSKFESEMFEEGHREFNIVASPSKL